MIRAICALSALTLALGSCGVSSDAGSTSLPPASIAVATRTTDLRAAFPAHAGRVLDEGGALVRTGAGFGRTSSASTGQFHEPGTALVATLPTRGDDAVTLRSARGFEVHVREVDATGDAELEANALTYPRRGGRSYWRLDATRAEEWLALDAGAAAVGETTATWEVDGATLRQAGDAVELVDEAGVARARVTAPEAFTAVGPVLVKLAAHGNRLELSVDAKGEAVLVDPQWTSTGSMAIGRQDHTATVLADGRVLVASGRAGFNPTPTAEVYSAVTEAWSPAGTLATARYNHAAARLPSGSVLVVGGYDNTATYATAELYSPTANGWSSAGSMSTARESPTATTLANGKVLVAGGVGTATAEMYDPATNAWSPAGSMLAARSSHTATLLENGTVFVAGGYGATGPLATAELYNPPTNTWSSAGLMATARYGHTAGLLVSGVVIVAGGYGTASPLASAELYNPAANAWSSGGPMGSARYLATATVLSGGKVLLAGGGNSVSLATAELYDPTVNAWSPTASLANARQQFTASLLGDGTVLVAGGFENSGMPLASAEVYSNLANVGGACAVPSDCNSGFCVDGVCCNTACNGGICAACSVAAGASTNGTCAALTGPSCNDGNACTAIDTCQAGVCTGSNPVTCPANDTCHSPSTCNPATGVCSVVPLPNGTDCDDGNACTASDLCTMGVCGGTSFACTPGVCEQTSTCNGATCTVVASGAGTACPDDGNPCTSDTCDGSGTCAHAALPDGTSCGLGLVCSAGVCAATSSGDAGMGGHDAGTVADAGLRDAGPDGQDAATISHDAATSDAGVTSDARATSDASMPKPDSGSTNDSGASHKTDASKTVTDSGARASSDSGDGGSSPTGQTGGCSCTNARQDPHSDSLAWLATFGVLGLVASRRRAVPSRNRT